MICSSAISPSPPFSDASLCLQCIITCPRAVDFLVRPFGAKGGRDSGDTPETPPGALPLDPASKKPKRKVCKVAIRYACYGSRDKVLVPGHYSRFVAQ